MIDTRTTLKGLNSNCLNNRVDLLTTTGQVTIFGRTVLGVDLINDDCYYNGANFVRLRQLRCNRSGRPVALSVWLEK